MSTLNLALVESKSLRNERISKLTDETALDRLNKAKSLLMAVWEGKNVATTNQIAEFYEVSDDVVRVSLQRNKDEFLFDGLQTLRGKDLKDARNILLLPSDTSQATVWTPRAALRLGMLLRDSKVAVKVRDVILDVVEAVPSAIAQPQRQFPPKRDAVEYLNAVKQLDELKDSRLKRLVEFRLMCEIEELNVNQKHTSDEGSPKKEEFTTCAVMAGLLGYTASQIGNGAALGKYVKSRLDSPFKDWQGQYFVYQYRVSEELNNVIHDYFAAKGIAKPSKQCLITYN